MSTTIPCPALSNLPLAFNDFDEETVFETAKEHFLKPDALNLVIEFDNSTARAAVDLNQEQIKAVLQAEVRYNSGNLEEGLSVLVLPS